MEDENNWNYKQEPVILIALMDFELPGSSPDHYYQYIQLCDLIQNKSIYDKLTIILIELPKFAKQLVSDEMVSSLSTLEKWLYTIRNMHILDKVPQFMLEGLFKQVVEFAEVKNMNKEQRAEYERSLRDLRDEQGLRDGAFDAGWTEGEENGRRIEREIAEKKQAESIKKLLILEISTSSIANILNIDESFVFEIQKSMGAEEK